MHNYYIIYLGNSSFLWRRYYTRSSLFFLFRKWLYVHCTIITPLKCCNHVYLDICAISGNLELLLYSVRLVTTVLLLQITCDTWEYCLLIILCFKRSRVCIYLWSVLLRHEKCTSCRTAASRYRKLICCTVIFTRQGRDYDLWVSQKYTVTINVHMFNRSRYSR